MMKRGSLATKLVAAVCLWMILFYVGCGSRTAPAGDQDATVAGPTGATESNWADQGVGVGIREEVELSELGEMHNAALEHIADATGIDGRTHSEYVQDLLNVMPGWADSTYGIDETETVQAILDADSILTSLMSEGIDLNSMQPAEFLEFYQFCEAEEYLTEAEADFFVDWIYVVDICQTMTVSPDYSMIGWPQAQAVSRGLTESEVVQNALDLAEASYYFWTSALGGQIMASTGFDEHSFGSLTGRRDWLCDMVAMIADLSGAMMCGGEPICSFFLGFFLSALVYENW